MRCRDGGIVKIGILGAAGIAPAAIIRPVRRRGGDVTVAAVAARDEERAASYAAEHGIPAWYGGYQRLIDDPDIDLIYNALPPSRHADLTIAALAAGKDVLCEKPFAMNAVQAWQMNDAAAKAGRRVIEAFHDRYHPLQAAILEILASGRLGPVRSMTANFSASIPFFPESLRHAPELGGGALMDLGCYAVHWLRTFAGEEPSVVSAEAELGPLGVDEAIHADLEFPSGIRGRVEASMAEGVALTQSLKVEAECGTLTVTGVVFPSGGHSIRQVIDGLPSTSTVAGQETYDHQLAAVHEGLRTGAPLPTEGDDPVANMALIDAIYAHAGVDRPTV
jgi:predicted dehydrogenase